MTRTGLFRYVTHGEVEQYHKAGWMIVQPDLGRMHGHWSVLMWHCDCKRRGE